MEMGSERVVIVDVSQEESHVRFRSLSRIFYGADLLDHDYIMPARLLDEEGDITPEFEAALRAIFNKYASPSSNTLPVRKFNNTSSTPMASLPPIRR